MEDMTRLAENERLSDIPAETPLTENLWGRVARYISAVTNPLFVALPTLFLMALHHAPDFLHALLWWSITVVGITVAPLYFIWRGVRLGHYSDHHVSIREQRFVPLAFGVGCVGIVFTLLLLLHATSSLLATVTAALITCLLAMVITLYWKISFHLLGMAGAVTALGLVFGPVFFLLSPLVVLVGWARWQVRAHTLLQALAGTLLAVSVTSITFWFFGIR